MSLDIYFYPILDVEKLKTDDNLVVDVLENEHDNKFYVIYLKPETPIEDIKTTSPDGFIMTYDLAQYADYTSIRGDMGPLLRYLFDKYELLFGFDGGLKDAGYRAFADYFSVCKNREDEVIFLDPIFIEYATDEMITYKDEYKWSDESLKKLIKINENNKENFNEFSEKYLPKYDNVKEIDFDDINKSIDVLNDDGLPF